MVGWEGAELHTADLTATDCAEPAADASADTKLRARVRRFQHRAAVVATTYSEGADTPERTAALRGCLEELEKLHAMRPDLGTVTMNLHWVAVRLGDQARAARMVEDFLAGTAREPQPVAYFARALNVAKRHDDAIKVLDRAATLTDYLGDELGVERMRAHAGKGDAKAAIAAFDRRVGEVTADLDQFHFAYHVAVAMGQPGDHLADLWSRHGETLITAFRARASVAEARMVYPVSLVGFLSRLKRTDDEVDQLLASLKLHKNVFGFQHFFYRSTFRIIEAGGPATPD